MSGKSNPFIDDMTFERELGELKEKGNPMDVAIFLAREVHGMCTLCVAHTAAIKELQDLHPTKNDTLLTGAGGGAVMTGIVAIIYYLGKWFHIWD